MVSILIVEDSIDKLGRLSKAISSVDGINIQNVEHAICSFEARKLLSRKKYDLVVFDIALPNRIGDDVDRSGGITLIKDILSRDEYIVPNNLICVTQYIDVFERSSSFMADSSIAILKYSASSDDFVKPLQSIVSRIQKALQQSRPIENYKTDLAIVCALKEPELFHVLQNGWDWKAVDVGNDNCKYYRATIVCDGVERVAVASSCLNMGMVSCAIQTIKTIELFRPRYIAMTGISAGVRGKSNMGDIIAAEVVWDWGNGKWAVRDDSNVFLSEPYQHRTNFELLNLIDTFSSTPVLKEIKDRFPGSKPESELRVLVGPVASGSCVIASKEIRDTVISQHRNLLGIDMEVYALFDAAYQSTLPQPIAISFKSVVDFADNTKDDTFHPYASYTSASALKFFFMNHVWRQDSA